jgi:hypothetical protein
LGRKVIGVLALVLGLLVATASAEGPGQPATPAEQYHTLLKEYQDLTPLLAKAKTDAERQQLRERRARVSLQILELAEQNPKDPVAVDALVEMVWRSMPGSDKALALLQREHPRSPRIGQVRVQTAFGTPTRVTILQQVAYFGSKEAETFLRTILETNPDREVQGQACLALAVFYVNRAQQLDLVRERAELAKRYQELHGKDYRDALRRERAAAIKQAEARYEQAIEQYGDVKFVSGGTIREKALAGLFGIRELIVGKPTPDIEGEDQDGKRFKLSDYRGKVVLLYFWHEF